MYRAGQAGVERPDQSATIAPAIPRLSAPKRTTAPHEQPLAAAEHLAFAPGAHDPMDTGARTSANRFHLGVDRQMALDACPRAPFKHLGFTLAGG